MEKAASTIATAALKKQRILTRYNCVACSVLKRENFRRSRSGPAHWG